MPALPRVFRPSRALAPCLALGVWAAALTAWAQARVEVFAPQGTAKPVRQVSARFSEPMVPLGDPRSVLDPFEIECAAQGRSRWADAHTWVHTFDQDLPAGVRCRFVLRDGLRTLAGNALGGARVFAFSTGGPSVMQAHPWGGSIAEDQRFALRLDAPAIRESVERHAWVQLADLPDPIPVRVVEGPEREAALATLGWKPDDPKHLVLEARQRFAPGAKLVLHWGPGIAAESGVATEADQPFEYVVRPPFRATLACTRERADRGCVPIAPIRVTFSAPVAWEKAAQIALHGAGGRTWRAERTRRLGDEAWVEQLKFTGPFPPHARLSAELPPDLVDESGRRLPVDAAVKLEIETDRLPPLAKFSARFGIVEAASPVLPVALRHVARDAQLRGVLAASAARVPGADVPRILDWLRALDRADAWSERSRSIFADPAQADGPRPLALPPLEAPAEAEVVGIPLEGPGLHVVEIESRLLGEALLGRAEPMYVAAGALVTDLGVHFKWGDESSLVWVTSLERGEPVAGARIRVADCSGKILAEAMSDAQGIARIAELPGEQDAARCDGERWSAYQEGLLVLASLGDDVGLVHTSWSRGIEPWRFGVPVEWMPRRAAAHTILDRALLRAGETLHMKHLLRRPVQAGFALAEPDARPALLRIAHQGSDDRWDLPLEWAPDGSALTDWPVPKVAKLGTYLVSLLPRDAPERQAQRTGSFRVEEFRVPLMRALIRPPDAALVAPEQLPLDLAVQYLAGGGAAALPVMLRTHVRPRSNVSFPDWDGFGFARGGLREGVRRRSFGEGWLGEHEWSWGEEGALGLVWRAPEGEGRAAGPVATQSLVLDAAGTARAVVPALPRADVPLEAQVEIEFRDPNGETATAARSVPLWPSARVIGLRGPWSVGQDEPLRVRAAVVDLEGRPRWFARVRIDAYERRSYAARKRMVGGFYAYENVEEVRRLGELCSGRTDRRGTFLCEAAPPATGEIVLVARTWDGEGRESATRHEVLVFGGDDWFAQGDADRIDLFPERRRYEPGDRARLQARTPFRKATALVTVEREGVGEAFVTRLSASRPFVDVPVLPAHAPNVFVSVLAVRGRVAAPAPTAHVDLARPAYRFGVAELRVGGRENELSVRVTPERSRWRVRETARVKLAVRTPSGEAPPPGGELALAVVDEGLLELAPNRSWKLLEAMLGRRSYGVRTSTAQMQVVGRRHFGRKAVSSGGGGGQLPTRELFDTLLLWRGRVPLDAAGDATVEIPLNDSLTSFRIAALATAGAGLFGSGEASIQTTQDLMLFSGLAPLVREGDRYAARFTLRNASQATQQLTLRASAPGLVGAPLEPESLELDPGESRELGWEVQAPAGSAALHWDVELRAASGAVDRLRVAQRVVPAVPERVLQASLVQISKPLRIALERPADALEGRGGVALALRPRLADGLDGVARFAHDYPHACLEQQASLAVALRDAGRWEAAMSALPAHLDADGLARFFPTAREGSEVLTAYLLAIAHESGWTIPEPQRERMLGALAGIVEGRLTRSPLAIAADLPLRKLAALEALARHGRATPQAVSAVAIEPVLLTNAGLLDWISVLERVPALPQRAAKLAAAERLLRARLDVQGTTLGFASSRGGLVDWLLATSDVSAARLVLSRLGKPQWRDDAPRLVRALLALQRDGAWPTTTANAWSVLALEKFSAAYEATPVAGRSEARLGAVREQVDWGETPAGGAFRLAWPVGRAALELAHAGGGAPWATLHSVAALPLRAPLESGYRIRKRWEPVQQRTPGRWSRGDVARIHLEIEADADASWVAVTDPIPAGASILGRGLGADSQLLASGERASGWAWEAYRENGLEAQRRYYEWVPRGRFGFEYSVRLNQAGRFGMPPTRVEALYAPERMGEIPNDPLEVAP